MVAETVLTAEERELVDSKQYRDSLERKAYHDLVRYIKFLVGINCVQNHWMLGYDDMLADGFLALAKAVNNYLYDKPYDEFMTLAKVCIKNEFRSQRSKAMGTHRKSELKMTSLDEPLMEDNDSDGYDVVHSKLPSPSSVVETEERMSEVFLKLNELERQVLNALLGGNERVRMYINLSKDRRNWVFKNSIVSVDAYIISCALCEPIDDVKEAMTHIGFLLSESVLGE